MKRTLFATALALMLLSALPARAQTGCDDSPEDPTVFLALVGGAGAIATTLMRLRRNK